MKKALFLLFVFATALVEGGCQPKPAVAWNAVDLNGKPISSDQLKGKVVVVDFWATWCAPCVAEIPGYIALQEKYRDRGLVIVGLSLDEGGPDVVKKFVQAKKMNYLVGMADDEVRKTFAPIEAIPTTFIIDREGRIQKSKTGALEPEKFEALVKPLL